LQVSLDLGGYAVVVSDTAGIRESSDVVEQEGVKRALERAQRADIRVFVFDVKVRAVF
jgi:tRNA modification GTPase